MTYPKFWGPLEVCEFKIIEETYRIYHGNKTHVAAALNLSLRAIRYKIRLYEQLGLIPEQTLSQRNPRKDDSKE